jgi:hypothetical protein
MNNKTGVLVLALGLLQMSGSAMAAPQGWTTPLNKVCFINSGSIYGGTAPAGLVTVVYGPYTAKCATTYHKFRLGLTLVKVEQLKNGVWSDRSGSTISPASQYGSGTYRLVIDNRNKQTATVYGGGTFSVPL